MRGFLVLEDGEVFSGHWHGGEPRAGEVVFNTSHSGYEEIATDPSYFSQIVVMTAPMQGNYSVDPNCWESRRYWIEGFISTELQNSAGNRGWQENLKRFSIPALSEVDTRRLVFRLREGGTPWGALVHSQSEDRARALAAPLIMEKKRTERDWVYLTSRKEKEVRPGAWPLGPRAAVLDLGSKENILRELNQRVSEIGIFNSRASANEILSFQPGFLMLTNGPGDPTDVQGTTDTVRALIGKLPIFGICMGHQILALALGAKTFKLKFGHRGSNHPIRDHILNKIYVTSQNHGYAVVEESLPQDVLVSHRNLNDKTVAGIYSEKLKLLGIQYHPEACPGPHEARELFSFFCERML